MTAALLTRPASSRRDTGMRPDPGATSRLPAWWGAEDWLAEVAQALDESADVLRDCHVSRDAALAVARALAGFADHRTGRDCRPTHERLLAVLRCSQSTMQRGRRALERLGLVVELIRGRNVMTRAERLEAWRRGSSARQVASTFALTSRRRRAPKERATRLEGGAQFGSAPASPVDRDHLPGAPKVSTSLQSRRSLLRRRTENDERGSAPRTDRGPRGGQSRRLAEAVRARLGWLSGQSWRRLAPALARFARAGWTVADVELAVRDVLAVRGHRVPRDLRYPAAYLAGILRDLDHEGLRPSVEAAQHEAWLAEQAAAERAGRRARLRELRGECAHGVAGGGAGQPSRGVAPCSTCHPGTIAR